ncbi:MAG: ExbD/TolR family protein [Thermoguttaceae bacterium]
MSSNSLFSKQSRISELEVDKPDKEPSLSKDKFLFRSGLGLSKRSRENGEMDITPMIDITFLLLIFFIVCSSLDRMDSVTLPPAYFGSAVSERNATVITVDGTGSDSVVYLGAGTNGTPLGSNRETQEQEIFEAVQRGLRDGKEAVVIRASGDLYQSEINRIKNVASVPGIKVLHFATKEVR